MGIEIERRFLVDGLSEQPWREGTPKAISQYYLEGVSLNEGVITCNGVELANTNEVLENISTWRVRKFGDQFFLTAKGRKIGATGIEFEWEITEEVWYKLDKSNFASVMKTRYLWNNQDGLLWEIDEYEGDLSGLIIAEVELDSEDQPVQIPDWTKMELTHLRGWSNAALSTMIKDSKQN